MLIPLALLWLGSAPGAQEPAKPAAPAQTPEAKPLLPTPQQPTRDVIRRSADLITSDVIVRNDGGQFVADLTKNDFDVYKMA